MLLTFLGRKSEEMLMHGEVGIVYELVAKSLRSLVQKVHTCYGNLVLSSNKYYIISLVHYYYFRMILQ
jgi:hypothetical protein